MRLSSKSVWTTYIYSDRAQFLARCPPLNLKPVNGLSGEKWRGSTDAACGSGSIRRKPICRITFETLTSTVSPSSTIEISQSITTAPLIQRDLLAFLHAMQAPGICQIERWFRSLSVNRNISWNNGRVMVRRSKRIAWPSSLRGYSLSLHRRFSRTPLTVHERHNGLSSRLQA
ncbi:hypothetical protein E1B28_011985 [Marasmius oreades]|uniref:Uncharacterized protein n=1 Tax=Marasmius oreades TaxID=181124 RepID=A0A9P7RQJ3_9AGAR|nr:uncharacterized protein E1B28_011985 [Marasmius oreades]KAG7087941.1 hypothetical protein E1B28_011985 [Marasmius oreades]